MLSFWLVLFRLGKGVYRCWHDVAFRTTLILVCLSLLSGTLFYRSIEGWSWLDAAYFSVATISTVGYGDLAPKSDVGKLFTIVFIPVGIGLFVALVTQIARALIAPPVPVSGKDDSKEDWS